MLVLVLACGLLMACGKGSHTSPSAHAATGASGIRRTSGSSSRQRAIAFARAVNLRPADVPGFTPAARHQHDSARERRLEHQMLHCAGIAGASRGLVEQGSENFELKHAILDFSVSSEVTVEQSAAQASRGLSAIRSSHVRECFSRYIEQSFAGQHLQGATLGPVSIQSGDPPAPGSSGSFGWRVTATFVIRAIKVPIYLDFLGFVQGPSEVTLLSSGLLRPFPAAVQQQLFRLLLSRSRAHRL
jgi:hypothetical protein